MAARADRGISFEDSAFFVNHITDAIGEPRFWIVASAIGKTNRAVSVTQEREGEIVLLREGGVLCDGVETHTQHFDIT